MTRGSCIALIDYGMGNLRSVEKALQKVGGHPKIAASPADLSGTDRIVLPGVGAFGDTVENLKNAGLFNIIRDEIRQGTPYLGICLGLQILFSSSEEKGAHEGFSIFQGKVRRFPGTLHVPQIGWNQVYHTEKDRILDGIPNGSFFYFVHSYYVDSLDCEIILTETEYTIRYVSGVSKDNVWGVQFHPEKSQDVGLRLLENFVHL